MKEITLACEAFQKLLEEQLERIRNMNGEKTDFSTKKQVTIGVIDGDGIGPVITAQATRVLEKLLAEEIAAGSIVIRQIEGLTIENRMACGKAIPDDVLAEIKTCDVLLKGPTTTPMGGKMESANVAMRRELDLYANCRPVCIPEKNIDWMFFRENTEGEYVLGSRGVELPGMAVDFKVTTDLGTRRIARAAFDYAKNNGKTHVAVVTKANIMKKTDGKFTAICHEVAADYPGTSLRGFPQELHRRPSSNCGCSAPGGTRRPPRRSSDRRRHTSGIPRSAAAYSPTEDAPLRADAACTSESVHGSDCQCRECRRWCLFPAKNPADAQKSASHESRPAAQAPETPRF